MRPLSLIVWLILSSGFPAMAQEAVFIIRHAEKELVGNDPSITEAGRARATAWAEMLQQVGLDAVFTSDARRTKQTGEIIATKLGLPLATVSRNDTVGLTDALSFDHQEERVLIVGHSETIPAILKNLGVTDSIEISEPDFANLFVLFQPGSDEPRLVRLRMP